jgi:hypothetical protein
MRCLPPCSIALLVILPAVSLGQSLATSQPVYTNATNWTSTPDGQYILHPFPHAPYPHASRSTPHVYQDKSYSVEDHYSDPTVGIFIPSNFRPAPDATNYLVHFHGWNNHVASVLDHYNLPHQLAESKANAILIVPQGPKDAPDSGDGKLENDEGALGALLDEISAYLVVEHKIPSSTIGHVAISAHSGGYKVASFVLEHGGLNDHITDCFLLDASYGNLDRFTHWVATSPNHRLISYFTTHLAPENKELMSLLTAAHVEFNQLDDKDFSLQTVSATGRHPLFIPTDLPHDQVPSKRDHVKVLLDSSSLAR